MPTAESIYDKLGGSNVFSTMDLFKGYHQVGIHPEDRPKTAFWGADRTELWKWKVMPFASVDLREQRFGTEPEQRPTDLFCSL
jgi:hypothetical protein